MPRARLTLALAGLLFLAACQPEPGPEQAPVAGPAASPGGAAAPGAKPSAATAIDPLAGTDAIAVVDRAAAAGAGRDFDVRAFAGRFGGAAPCAGCPDIVLELRADGRFLLTGSERRQAGPPVATEGTWSLEHDDSQVLLDPDSKDGQDRRYAIAAGHDELQPLDLQGNPLPGGAGDTLVRMRADD